MFKVLVFKMRKVDIQTHSKILEQSLEVLTKCNKYTQKETLTRARSFVSPDTLGPITLAVALKLTFIASSRFSQHRALMAKIQRVDLFNLLNVASGF